MKIIPSLLKVNLVAEEDTQRTTDVGLHGGNRSPHSLFCGMQARQVQRNFIIIESTSRVRRRKVLENHQGSTEGGNGASQLLQFALWWNHGVLQWRQKPRHQLKCFPSCSHGWISANGRNRLFDPTVRVDKTQHKMLAFQSRFEDCGIALSLLLSKELTKRKENCKERGTGSNPSTERSNSGPVKSTLTPRKTRHHYLSYIHSLIPLWIGRHSAMRERPAVAARPQEASDE